MQSTEMNSILHNSCEQYYKYLKENDKGLDETKPLGVKYDDLHYKITLRVRFAPKDMNNLQFRFGTHIYTQAQIEILEFDEKHKTLLLQLDKATFADIKDITVNNIALIDDLKWLVERVRLWYQKNRDDFVFPSKRIDMVNDIIFPYDALPSNQQINAINAILSGSVTYIWGTPGTGKTKFVMSYAVANYFKRNYPVLILAPTNHALDQALSGILPVLEKLDMDLSKVIRLGTATGNMPEKYAFLCENKEVKKEIDFIEKQLDVLNSQLDSLAMKSAIKIREQLQDELTAARAGALNAQRRIDDFSTNQLSLFDESNFYYRKRNDAQIAEYTKELLEAEACINLLNDKLSVLNSEISAAPFSNKAQISEIEENISKLNNHKKELLDRTDPYKKYKNKLIVACTLDHCLWHEITKLLDFKHIFLDEAAFSCMAKALPLMTTNTPLTLLGDHMQLPPVCEADEREFMAKDSTVFFWAQSALYMESAFNKNLCELKAEYLENIPAEYERIKKLDLTATYRFGKRLVDTLDNFVYGIGLTSRLDSETNIFYVNVPEPKNRPVRINGSGSRANPEEALVISDLSNNLHKDFVVLTPYVEQVKEINFHAQDLAHNGQVMTIHKSQGSEWGTVILSVADTSNMWFTNTQKRQTRALELINTAVSRAKNELIIVCDYTYWIKQNNQLITALLKNARQLENC